jgi:hypothetical protein
MANISPLNYPYFTNNVTQLNAENLNPIVEKINQLVHAVNSGTIVTPEVPTILFDTSNETVALTATEGLAILYSTNGSSTPETPYDAALSVARGVNLTTRTTNGLEYSEVPKISVKYNKVSGTIEFIAFLRIIHRVFRVPRDGRVSHHALSLGAGDGHGIGRAADRAVFGFPVLDAAVLRLFCKGQYHRRGNRNDGADRVFRIAVGHDHALGAGCRQLQYF